MVKPVSSVMNVSWMTWRRWRRRVYVQHFLLVGKRRRDTVVKTA